MGLVAAKCTQCGANVKVDDTKEAGICEFCGTAFITEKAINNYNTYITNNNNFAGANINVIGGDIDNYLKLANNAIEAENGQEALSYANKALEIKADSCEAWIAKMKSIEFIGTMGDPRVSEAVSYGENAIKFALESDKDKVTDEVYNYYMKRAITLMMLAIAKTQDVTQIKNLVGISPASIQGVANGDSTNRTLFGNLTTYAINIKLKIPESYIANHQEMQEQIAALAKLYISYCKADVERLKIYGSFLLQEALDARETNLNLIKKGLTEEKTTDIKNDEVKSNNTSGCYIATCVYGSYDCPQVWTLRRYRDYTLEETWYGRLFIKCYYAVSPTLVKWFGETKWFRQFWKSKLDKMVFELNDKGVQNTYYHDKY